MKKALILIVVLAVALGISFLALHKSSSENGKAEEKDEPLVINSKTSAFNRSIGGVLSSYFRLSEGFAEADSARIALAARSLLSATDSIRFDQFKADSAIVLTAINLAQSMQGEIAGLNGETQMEQKKREFNMITDQLYSLIRTVRYDGSTIYHMRCSAAFPDSSEGYWLSPTNTIVNPYLGKNYPVSKSKIEDLGAIIDSIHFSVPDNE